MNIIILPAPIANQNRVSATAQFAGLAVAWLISIIACRIGELIYTSLTHRVPGFVAVLSSLLTDSIYFLQSSFFLFILFSFLSFLSGRLARLVHTVLCVLLVLVQVALLIYFTKTSVLLGGDLYSYSADEINQTVGAAGGLSIGLIGGLAGVVGLVLVIFTFIPRRIQLGKRWLIGLVSLGALALIVDVNEWTYLPTLPTEYETNLVVNKSAHLMGATLAHVSERTDEGVDIYADAYSDDYGETSKSSEVRPVTYLAESQYPFLRTDDTPDVLGPFFTVSPAPPNVVILIVEGLGRAFTGADAYLGSFTPFIDSLAQRGLYWENFLSEGGRTFAVLPSLLGSLPFGREGFADLGHQMPSHLSLPGILKKNGYQSAFYYGGSSRFDNMNAMLRKQGVDRISDEPTYGPGYQKMPGANGFTWGYGDKELFRHYFSVNNPADVRPKLQVLLTVSTHDPFRINEQGFYLQKAEKRIEALSLTEDQRQDRRRYKFQFASVLYTDDALRVFFAAYRKRPDFARTIFLITGDHRMPEIPMSTKLDRYHIPLIVYSPLLKRRATFRSISTHFDVTPTLLAFLKTNYALKTPPVVSWLGTGIDTTRQFRNAHAYPLKVTKAELVDFVMGPYMLNQNKLYRIGDDMNLEPVKEPAQLDRLNGAFDQFKQKNERFFNGARLVPDSVLTRYN